MMLFIYAIEIVVTIVCLVREASRGYMIAALICGVVGVLFEPLQILTLILELVAIYKAIKG